MKVMQRSFWNGKLDCEKLGGFVYALIDPRTNNVFYVGLGGGIEAQGNQRPENHLVATLTKISTNELLSDKEKIIRDIWNDGLEVKLAVVRRNLTRKEAIHVEAALIDIFQKVQEGPILTNMQSGHGKKEHSIITEDNLVELVAEPVNPSVSIENVWLFNIRSEMDKGRTAYESTLGNWVIADRECGVGYAVGLKNGISRTVIKIESWQTMFENKNGKKILKKKITGIEINKNEIGLELLEKDYSAIINGNGFWLRGRPLRVNFYERKALVTYGQKNGKPVNLC
ncbi:MAG: hypothetical protein BWY40_00585 [bacterium ADurb.Bin270]|nr:hypothetical protein [Myxococcales bacterium]OQA61572.1 MAG: hypothetical protein BWY40_00585 [bacterium ADurb.Bin270]